MFKPSSASTPKDNEQHKPSGPSSGAIRAGQRFLAPSAVSDFARSSESDERIAVAGNPRVTLTSVIELINDPHEHVRRALLGRIDVTVGVASRLAHDVHWSVRIAAITTGRLPSPFLEEMAADPHPEVRATLAALPDLPIAAAHALSRDENLTVRLTIARCHGHRANLDPRSLAEWAQTTNSEQLMAAWQLPPRSQWQELMTDPAVPSRLKVLVAVAARWRLGQLEGLLTHDDDAVRRAVQHNPRMRWSRLCEAGFVSAFTVVNDEPPNRG